MFKQMYLLLSTLYLLFKTVLKIRLNIPQKNYIILKNALKMYKLYKLKFKKTICSLLLHNETLIDAFDFIFIIILINIIHKQVRFIFC